jgi:hypothetical protein
MGFNFSLNNEIITVDLTNVGDTGVCRDTGSRRGTIGGKIVYFNKIQNFFRMNFISMPANLACI